MNVVEFKFVYLLTIFVVLGIHGLSQKIPPERCYLFYLNATAAFHEDNRQPATDDLQKIIDILKVPYDSDLITCNETNVTIHHINFTSTSALNKTRMNLVLKIQPKENVTKSSAHACAENMVYRAITNSSDVEWFLGFCDDNMSTLCYTIQQKPCCEEEHLHDEPCCRKGYSLKNLTCVKDLEIKKGPDSNTKKGEVVKMETETGDKCEQSGQSLSVGIIILVSCSCLVLFVFIVLAGMRVWKHKRRSNITQLYNVAIPENQTDERKDTGEIPYSVTLPVIEETKDGYVPMKNLSRTDLTDQTNATINTNPTTTTTKNSNDTNSLQNSTRNRVHSFRPLSRQEMLFDFDKHIPIENIEFTSTMLGRGQFGQVELANVTINGIKMKCAVKMIRGRGTLEDERELFEELQMLYQIPHHPNVVSLLGGCMDDNSPLYVVVEYCAKGNLLKYLQANRNSSNEYVNFSGSKLDFRWKLNRALEVCKGMIFLAQRQIIHRDLAARNILLDEDEVAKISDFGMAKDVYLRGLYVKETAGFLPVRWMAIEAIESSIYTIRSDMWSFGILLWELYMDGRLPYPGVSDASKLLLYLQKGYRMAQPENCPDSFYQLMDRCWLGKPEERPPFTQVLRELEIIKDEEMRRESESSGVTEISDDLPVFVDEAEMPQELTQPFRKGTQGALEDPQTPKEENEVNTVEEEPPMEIGVVNHGRSSIDSGVNVELRNMTQDVVERTSHS